jgi:SAM-dependent methyltransferase
VIVVLHDLHHADPASAAVLTDLLTRLRTGGLFVLATATDPARLPAGTGAWWPWLFATQDPTSATDEVRTAVVGGLDALAVAALVASRRPASPVPGPVAQPVRRRERGGRGAAAGPAAAARSAGGAR